MFILFAWLMALRRQQRRRPNYLHEFPQQMWTEFLCHQNARWRINHICSSAGHTNAHIARTSHIQHMIECTHHEQLNPNVWLYNVRVLHTWALKCVNQIFHAAQYPLNSTVIYMSVCETVWVCMGYIRLSLLLRLFLFLLLLLLLNTPAITRLPLNNNLLF